MAALSSFLVKPPPDSLMMRAASAQLVCRAPEAANAGSGWAIKAAANLTDSTATPGGARRQGGEPPAAVGLAGRGSENYASQSGAQDQPFSQV